MTHPFVVIGNPENRRIDFLQRALAREGLSRAIVFSYCDLLAGRQSIADAPSNAFVRIESPGEDFAVERGLLALGATVAAEEGSPHLPREACLQLAEDRGRLWYPRQWYLGFCALLRSLAGHLHARDDLEPLSCPTDIERVFDKRRCHQQLQAAGIPTPPSLGPVGRFTELASAMETSQTSRAFVKLAHGSSASGVVAIERQRNAWLATTTVEMEPGDAEVRLYNSRKLRRYTGTESVGALVDSLALHGVHVERWLPKAAIDGRVFDLRVVLIKGEPQHMVVRTSRGPITNLHLGNRRGDLDRLLERWPRDSFEAMLDTCRAVGRQFARSLQLGVDMLVTPGFREHAVLEVNAFGDLLPRVTCNGKDTYEAQVAAAFG